MSLITIEQFDEFEEAYPELAQCYKFPRWTQPGHTWDDFEDDWETHS